MMESLSYKALKKSMGNGKPLQQAGQSNPDHNFMRELVPPLDWSQFGESDHFVQFYEADEFLLDLLGDYINRGLSAGDACVVVATKEHLKELEQRLQNEGLDIDACKAAKQFVTFDAAETLSRFMVKGLPDPHSFAEIIGAVLAQAAAGGRRVRVFGEMVALLWAEGNQQAAIHLEELWDNLSHTHTFLLFCAYPIDGFTGDGIGNQFNEVCSKHVKVIPGENYTALTSPFDRLRTVSLLQQRARLLESEAGERKRAEELSLHLAAIVESSDDAIIGKSMDGIIQSWNRGAERIFGYSAEEVIGKSIYILIPPDKYDEETKILEHLKRGERVDHFETIRVTKDGKKVYISLTVSPIKDKTDKLIGASKVARDITERKQAEEKLREQSEMIETLNFVGRILSADLNMENVVQTVTDAATSLTGAQFGSFFYNIPDSKDESSLLYRLSGLPRETFQHFPMPQNTDLFGPTFRAEGVIRIADVKKDPRYGKTSPYFGMSGHLPITSYLVVPVISRSGEVLGGLFFGHPREDVFTERHTQLVKGLAAQAATAMDNAKLYELSQQEKAKAEEANRAKDEFLATISHELRTPLNAILGWSYVLRSTNLDGEVLTQAIEAIDRNAKSQAQLIEDILDVSRIITGKLRLNEGLVDLVSVINAAIDSVQLAADTKSIRLSLILDPSARQVSGDSIRLQQVIWNLLANAIKFTPSGGCVEVRLERTGSYVRIIVSDTGEGISRKFLPFIFERFRQADGSSTRRQGGLGLGLAIVKHLVELHGGTIEAASEGEGCGSTFIAQLPHKAVVDTHPERRTRSVVQNLNDNASRMSVPLLVGLKILIVDDDRDTLEMLATVLSESRAEVQAVSSVAEAMTILQSHKPDVLVSDLAMPYEDGYSLISKVRNLDAQGEKPILAVALTALVRVEDRMRALSAGFNLFVPKPIEPDELINAIANLVQSNLPKGLRTVTTNGIH